jgi:hypothetical protein
MTLTGPCKILFQCPYCNEIYGGVAHGGIIKMCRWCKMPCDKRELPVVERFCGSERCIVHAVLGVNPDRLEIGDPG